MVFDLGVLNIVWFFEVFLGVVTCGDFLVGVLVSEYLCLLFLVVVENLRVRMERKMWVFVWRGIKVKFVNEIFGLLLGVLVVVVVSNDFIWWSDINEDFLFRSNVRYVF